MSSLIYITTALTEGGTRQKFKVKDVAGMHQVFLKYHQHWTLHSPQFVIYINILELDALNLWQV